FDGVVVDGIAVLVGAHELDAGLGEGGAVGRRLVERGGGQVDRLHDLHRRHVDPRGRLATGGRCGGRARLQEVLRERLDLDPVPVLVVARLALDRVDAEECVLHDLVFLLFRSSVRLMQPALAAGRDLPPPTGGGRVTATAGSPPLDASMRYDFLAPAGSSATSRSETDSSSSWKCGLTKATAR